MPSSRILIASNTLSSAAASVTFSAIPSSYTDLVLRFSARNSNASSGSVNTIDIRVNNLLTSIYSETNLDGDGVYVYSNRESNVSSLRYIRFNGSDSTNNTFSSNELYFPNYTSSSNKTVSNYNVVESNSSTAGNTRINTVAGLIRTTNAISSIKIESDGFASGSSFFLYGLKNS